MKRWICTALAVAMMLGCAGVMAQEYVSITEVYDQAQAMGGWWKETFDTPNGEVSIDAPIIVPDVETMPVITVEKAKISEELFNQIAQGKKTGDEDDHQYEIELDGKVMEFFFGRDKYYIFGERTDFEGYDAYQTLWIQHGDFRTTAGTGTGLMQRSRPITYHDIADVDMDKAYMRGSEQTVNDIMRVWQDDIELCLGEGYVIKPTNIEVNGSVIIENPGNDKVYKRDGYTYVYAEQQLEGVPIFGGLAWNTSGNAFSVAHVSTKESNERFDQLRSYRVGVDHCSTRLVAISHDDENYRTMTDLVKVRTIEHEDIPMVTLESVLAGVEKEIKEGHIRSIESICLGYILYSNPDMLDYAWAIPSWRVSCEYVPDEMAKEYKEDQERERNKLEMAPTIEDEQVYVYTGEYSPEAGLYYTNLPVGAQSGEPIVFTIGNEKVFSVPEIITWDEVK